MGYCRVPVLATLLLVCSSQVYAQLRDDRPATHVLVQRRIDQDIRLPGYRNADDTKSVRTKSAFTDAGLSLRLPGAGHG